MTRRFFYITGFVLVVIPVLWLLGSCRQDTAQLQREFAELRFGGFFHFGIMTFTGAPWATPNQDVSKFNPSGLDCSQWADAAAAAGMKYGILTTKHHDGFCLWNSAYTDNDVARSPWKNGQGDVVREYVDAFRAHGLEPCLYYSVWDNTAGIGNGPIGKKEMNFIKGQLTELLTNYGPIKLLFIDGWSWKTGHRSVPYDEIRSLVKKLQPECLLVDNTHLRCLYHNDLIHFEAGGAGACPADNTIPALLSVLINKNSGNDWFWDTRVPGAELMSVDEIMRNNLEYLEPRWCSFILNCPPNTSGKLDSNIVQRLKEVGRVFNPDLKRPPLPPQAITIDLGRVYDDFSLLYYVPKYIPVVNPLTEGSIKAYKIYAGTDSANYGEVAAGEWNGDVQMKVAKFTPTRARYIRLEVLSAVGGFAAATEIAVGR